VKRFLVAIVLLGSVSCVTTQRLSDASPDPRDDLPALNEAQEREMARVQREKLAAQTPLISVLELSPRDPIVNVRVVFKAGAADDPAGKEGLASLTATLMRQGTDKLSAAELADTLFPWAAEIGVQVDKDTIVFMGRVHQDHAAAWADVFLDVITKPRLDAKDFARVKEEQRAFIENTLRTGNDEALQREALELAIYPKGHVYAHTPAGTVAGLKAIKLDDVRAFIASTLTRDRVVLGVSGGAPPAVVAKLQKALEALPFAPEGTERALPGAPAPPAKTAATFIEKPSAGSAISVGFELESLSRSHADYPAMKLAETWFGEHRNLIGHLFNSMREVRGLNYGDYAYVEHFAQEGWSTYERLNITRRTQYFSIWIRPVEHKNRLFALRQTLWELDKLVAKGIPDDESFQRVQSFVQGYWRAKEQEPMRALGYRIDQVLTKQPMDREAMRAAVMKLTRADVNAAIARHLRRDKLRIVVVTTDAAALEADILANKPSPLTYGGKMEDKKQLAEDKEIEAFDLGLADADITIVPPTAFFED
jgi:zinc protease